MVLTAGGALVTMIEGTINERWSLMLPDFRVKFHADRPKWEAGRLADMADRIEEGMTIFDVGAEHGDFTALYRSWTGSPVIPVEPAAAYWPCIKATFEANGYEAPYGYFRGFAGDVDLPEVNRERWDIPGAVPGFGVYSWPREARGPVVEDPGFLHLSAHRNIHPVITLDTLADALFVPDIVVMDIEGAEWHALSGCTHLMHGGRTTFYVSVHEPTLWNWYEKTLVDIHDLCASFDYAGTELPHNGEGETFWRFNR